MLTLTPPFEHPRRPPRRRRRGPARCSGERLTPEVSACRVLRRRKRRPPRPRAGLHHRRRCEATVTEPFDALALDLARFQAAHVPAIARLRTRGARRPAPRCAMAASIPAVPSDVFRLAPHRRAPAGARRRALPHERHLAGRGGGRRASDADDRDLRARGPRVGRTFPFGRIGADWRALVLAPPIAEQGDFIAGLHARLFRAPWFPRPAQCSSSILAMPRAPAPDRFRRPRARRRCRRAAAVVTRRSSSRPRSRLVHLIAGGAQASTCACRRAAA